MLRQRSGGPSYRRTQRKPKPKECFFCVNNIINIDYKDAELLRKFISSHAKIAPTRRNGVCTWHQRKLATAIKHARHMALLPFVVR